MQLGQDRELDALRKRVRELAAQYAPPRHPRTGVRAPEPEQIPALRKWTAVLFGEQLLGVNWPVEYGGLENPHPLHEKVVTDELVRIGAAGPVGGGLLAGAAIVASGTKEQKDYFLPRIRSGEHIWCQLFSEPEAGSDLAGLRTRARREGGEFVVDGQKVWTTNAHHADWGYLLARTDPDAPKHAGITAFALDMRTPGVTVRPLREITGTADFNEVFLDGVRIPADRVIGKVNEGWAVTTASLALERSSAGSGASLFGALNRLARLAGQVTRDGRPAIERDDVRQAIGGFAAEVYVNALVSAYGDSRALHGSGDVADAPVSKILFSQINLALHEYGMQLQGHDGVRIEGDAKVHDDGWWQDAFLYGRAFTIAGGTNEVLRNLIAERALGLPR
ncbi:acyl-CoA dehydrogenase, N-terminal domain protein [Mycolicibacterium hassiacum DSM 44199]|uniref:Acyl-CoA dehydrogenase, N-terminal domain protein n=1 Tax=Mycolicibacterium hassiacum (strain DSM 44199 / CIP 105218 / JCM 12690 / 3849) TaxID=1122247 RepID=K5BGY0_MYCHD|nr:acyl-CoA dehydrogenase family protein [Mycolicibacterium hassiacum]EKF25187.1 acyl-CoA dehydrogenase, N-terminal domain protein [Mycolicibacterium hassiacum DSM 44199]MDA4087934.1 acyl-CoA dehydrogenase [Mycolicibacterium hassiacum DSM 44199]PZN17976.1 MAG: acyl-CoA dehydrogenase [Mycolicibacterium hassiacum]VCT93223.1 Putative acyl-CoA dehydrogenase FadE17 [Mycolicibacterium hassiacum DSM 44199]